MRAEGQTLEFGTLEGLPLAEEQNGNFEAFWMLYSLFGRAEGQNLNFGTAAGQKLHLARHSTTDVFLEVKSLNCAVLRPRQGVPLSTSTSATSHDAPWFPASVRSHLRCMCMSRKQVL